ncbi:MAG: MerR family transcriptional regulator [Clostridia bacterium]|nr:MerR family transcriptional regulator [Clostridia bacterium]
MQYQIGDFSKISRLSIKTLRYYHEIGLLSPTHIDQHSGYRYYDEGCLEKARVINMLKNLEFSLESIKEILSCCSEDSNILPYMEQKLCEIKQKIIHYTEMEEKINSFIKLESKVHTYTSSNIVIKEVPEICFTSVRYKGRYNDINQYINYLFKTYGNITAGSPFSLYYDNDSVDNEADIEVCMPVSAGFPDSGIVRKILEGGKVISVIHKGSYESIYKTYKEVVDYVNTNRYRIIYPIREIYLKGSGIILKSDPSKFITEIQCLFTEK